MRSISRLFILSFLFTQPTLASQTELEGYSLPHNKQGVADRNYDKIGKARYQVFSNQLDMGIQKFNYYWANAENKVPASDKPMQCPNGYTLFPENKSQLREYGIHHYHCYKTSFIKRWEKTLENNANYNMQSALVLWSAPEQYRAKGCEGFTRRGNQHLKNGCYPEKKYLDDYEDWVRFTAVKFGKFVDHYIVWNEAESTNWADTSSHEMSKAEMANHLDSEMKRSFSLYTDLLKRTIKATEELDSPAGHKPLVYVSLDRDWYSKEPIVKTSKNGATHIRWRNENLMDYIWNNLGLSYNWSVTLHAYGEATKKDNEGISFAGLEDFSKYQKEQIQKRTSKDWLSFPQSRIFTSEQNVGHHLKINDWSKKAQFICESYDIAEKSPSVIAITHNHFQGNINAKRSDGYSMLPASVGASLANANKYETFKAYKSTTTQLWGKSNNHYCCTRYGLGCK